jgi:hypothetical protein
MLLLSNLTSLAQTIEDWSLVTKGGERVGESYLKESWERRNECAKLGQRLEIRWVAYILGLGWATRSSGGSHRNFWSNEIRPLGLSVNSGLPELPVPGPELPVHIRTSGRNPKQFSRTRARAQTTLTETFGAWPELPVSTETFGRRPEQNTRTRTHVSASDRNFRCTSLQPTKLRQEHFLSPFFQLDLYPSW